MFLTAALSFLLWPAATGACKPHPHPDSNSTAPSGNGTAFPPEDDTPWVPTCKLPASNSVWLSVGHDYKADCVPSTGELKAFMFIVDFPDAESADYETPEDYRASVFPDATQWYDEASYGALSFNVSVDTSRFYRMSKTAASYNWDNGVSSLQNLEYIKDALDAFTDNGKRPAPAETEILIIVPVRSASTWMTRSMTFHGGAYTRRDEYVARKTITFGTDLYYWGFKALNHEAGHAMCLPDYYPYSGSDPTGVYVGDWSAMGIIGGMAPDYFSWDKWRLGWLSDGDVNCVLEHGTTEHILHPLSAAQGTRAVVVAVSKTSALVAELRLAKGLDTSNCNPGVLLYTVDTTKATGDGPIQVLDANPNSGGCGSGDYVELNDGTLSLEWGAKELEVPGWGVKVTLLEVDGEKHKIRVEYSK